MLDAAVKSIAETGPSALSLRALSAKAGVSHAAPVHHFGDKAGLFSAVAAEGFHLLAIELVDGWEETGDFLEVGVRYVRFALDHKGYFEVMFRPELQNLHSPGLLEAKRRAFTALVDPLSIVGPSSDDDTAFHWTTLSSWSIVHGLATLALSGNLLPSDLADPDELARQVLLHLPFDFARSYEGARHNR
jgi:AcrR family transcriptional regulator